MGNLNQNKAGRHHSDYPKRPIGGGNPYHCCAHCGRSDPEINGVIEKHEEWCEYRIKKLSIGKTAVKVYAVMEGWSAEGEGSGEDIESLKLFFNKEDAEKYKREKEREQADDLYSGGLYVEMREVAIE